MVMKQVRDAMAGILDKTTLAQVCRRVDEARENAAQGSQEYDPRRSCTTSRNSLAIPVGQFARASH
jgi:hypothetical protein